MIVVFMNLLNAYGRERMRYVADRNELPQHPEFFSSSIELLPDAVLIQLDKIIVAANNPVARLIGIERGALIGRTVTDFVSTGSSTNYVIDHEADNLTVHYDDDLILADADKTLNVRVTATSINYAGELATLMILRPVEEEAESTIDLEDRETIFRELALTMSDYAYALEVDARGQTSFAWLSGNFKTKTGLSFDEIMALADWATLIHEEDKAFYALHCKALLQGEPHSIEYRVPGQDGLFIWIQDSAYPVYDTQQKSVIRIQGVASDVTEKIETRGKLKNPCRATGGSGRTGFTRLEYRRCSTNSATRYCSL